MYLKVSNYTFRDEKGSNNNLLGITWYGVSFIAFVSLITMVVLEKSNMYLKGSNYTFRDEKGSNNNLLGIT